MFLWFIFKMLAVSFPEALEGVYIAFLLLGMTKFLPYICDRADFRRNMLRLLSFSSIYAFSFELLRLVFPVPIMSFPIKTAIVIISLKLIYKINWKTVMYSVFIMLMFLIVAEPLVVSPVLNMLKVGFVSWMKNGTYSLFFTSLPIRAVGLIIIASLWNFKIVHDDLTQRRRLSLKRTVQLIAFLTSLVLFEVIFLYVVLASFYALPLEAKVAAVIGCLLMGYINYMICVVYLNIVSNTVESINKFLKGNDKDEKSGSA